MYNSGIECPSGPRNDLGKCLGPWIVYVCIHICRAGVILSEKVVSHPKP